MAKHILKLEEFEICGDWYCSHTAEICTPWEKWYIVPYALKITPYEYVKLLKEQYKPDYINLVEGPYGSVLNYYWKSQAAMRKWKNYINAQLRKHQFYVG